MLTMNRVRGRGGTPPDSTRPDVMVDRTTVEDRNYVDRYRNLPGHLLAIGIFSLPCIELFNSHSTSRRARFIDLSFRQRKKGRLEGH